MGGIAIVGSSLAFEFNPALAIFASLFFLRSLPRYRATKTNMLVEKRRRFKRRALSIGVWRAFGVGALGNEGLEGGHSWEGDCAWGERLRPVRV